MAIVVQKFGGTSVADAEKIRKAASRAMEAATGNQVVVVASARGKQTDQLVADALELNPNPPKREMDMLLSTGEQQTVSLMAMALEAMGQKAISFTGSADQMITDDAHTKARIQSIGAENAQGAQSRQYRHRRRFSGRRRKRQHHHTWPGRLRYQCRRAAALSGRFLRNLYRCGRYLHHRPAKISKSRQNEQISYDEMLELASLGAGVMHGRAIEFGKKYNVKIHVRSSMNEKPGTLITHEVPQMEGIVVSGATIQKDLAKIALSVSITNPATPQASSLTSPQNKLSSTISSRPRSAPKKPTCRLPSPSPIWRCKSCDRRNPQRSPLRIVIHPRRHRRSLRRRRRHAFTLRRSRKNVQIPRRPKINIDSITTSEIRISCIVDIEQAEKALVTVCEAFELDKPAADRNPIN